MLRMAGFDTLYDNNIDDDEVEALAVGDAPHGADARPRTAQAPRHRARPLRARAAPRRRSWSKWSTGSAWRASAAPFTLCLHCNAPLRAVDKALVLDQLPDAVRAHHQQFSTCDLCHRVYWKGSHWKRMGALLDGVARRRAVSGCVEVAALHRHALVFEYRHRGAHAPEAELAVERFGCRAPNTG